MRITIISLLLMLTLVPAQFAAEQAIPGSKEAVYRLQQLWRDSLAAKLKDSPHLAVITRQMFEPGRVGARRTDSRAALKLVSDTLSPAEKKQLIVFGALDVLDHDKSVWAVTNPGDDGNGFEAYLDAKTGELLFLWIIPEG